MGKVVNSSFLDRNFIFFPIWIPIIYFLLIENFQNYEQYIFLAFFFLLGETHFGSSWLLFIDKNKLRYVKSNIYIFFYIPVLILLFSVAIATFLGIDFLLFLILLFNFFHVTRQSIGVLKITEFAHNLRQIVSLYGGIYLVCFLCVVSGSINFLYYGDEYNLILDKLNFYIYFLFFLFSVVNLFFFLSKKISLNCFLSFLTGSSMFLPLCFIDQIHHAMMMGIGMHYSQYLFIALPVFFRRLKSADMENKKLTINNAVYLTVFYLSVYSLLMVILANNKDLHFLNIPLFLIPVLFQTLHFYIDMFIWRFSNPNIRNIVLPFMFKKFG